MLCGLGKTKQTLCPEWSFQLPCFNFNLWYVVYGAKTYVIIHIHQSYDHTQIVQLVLYLDWAKTYVDFNLMISHTQTNCVMLYLDWAKAYGGDVNLTITQQIMLFVLYLDWAKPYVDANLMITQIVAICVSQMIISTAFLTLKWYVHWAKTYCRHAWSFQPPFFHGFLPRGKLGNTI